MGRALPFVIWSAVLAGSYIVVANLLLAKQTQLSPQRRRRFISASLLVLVGVLNLILGAPTIVGGSFIVIGAALLVILFRFTPLALGIWLITFLSTYFFAAKTWWMPVGASTLAAPIDAQFRVTYWAMAVVFVAAQGALGLFTWQYRDRAHTAATYTHGNLRLEIVWTVLTAILFVGLNLMGEPTWAAQRFQGPGAGAVPVEITGAQFEWYFRYPGPDGKFGAAKASFVDFTNPFGLDAADPAGADDVVTVNELRFPLNERVLVRLTSKDVIHSFFIPEFRVKQDAVPGLAIPVWFTPTRVGDYEITCAQLCGVGHAIMRADVKVEPRADLDAWLLSKKTATLAAAPKPAVEQW